MQRFWIEFRSDRFRSKDRLDFRTEDKRLRSVCVIKRFDTDVIANERQGSFAIVPDGESKHAVETADSFPTPLVDRSEQHFGIAVGFELVSERAKLFAQFAVVVDFAVEGENETAVGREHRLVTGRGGVDGAQ